MGFTGEGNQKNHTQVVFWVARQPVEFVGDAPPGCPLKDIGTLWRCEEGDLSLNDQIMDVASTSTEVWAYSIRFMFNLYACLYMYICTYVYISWYTHDIYRQIWSTKTIPKSPYPCFISKGFAWPDVESEHRMSSKSLAHWRSHGSV